MAAQSPSSFGQPGGCFPTILVLTSLRVEIPRRVALQCEAAAADKAGKEPGATMEYRVRPQVGRALHWSSFEPVLQCGPELRDQGSGDGGSAARPGYPIPFRRVPIFTTWAVHLGNHLNEEK
jgi:hypothetical protein